MRKRIPQWQQQVTQPLRSESDSKTKSSAVRYWRTSGLARSSWCQSARNEKTCSSAMTKKPSSRLQCRTLHSHPRPTASKRKLREPGRGFFPRLAAKRCGHSARTLHSRHAPQLAGLRRSAHPRQAAKRRSLKWLLGRKKIPFPSSFQVVVLPEQRRVVLAERHCYQSSTWSGATRS